MRRRSAKVLLYATFLPGMRASTISRQSNGCGLLKTSSNAFSASATVLRVDGVGKRILFGSSTGARALIRWACKVAGDLPNMSLCWTFLWSGCSGAGSFRHCCSLIVAPPTRSAGYYADATNIELRVENGSGVPDIDYCIMDDSMKRSGAAVFIIFLLRVALNSLSCLRKNIWLLKTLSFWRCQKAGSQSSSVNSLVIGLRVAREFSWFVGLFFFYFPRGDSLFQSLSEPLFFKLSPELMLRLPTGASAILFLFFNFGPSILLTSSLVRYLSGFPSIYDLALNFSICRLSGVLSLSVLSKGAM